MQLDFDLDLLAASPAIDGLNLSALKSGDLDATLAELDTLPEAAKPALADWRALAETRARALSAGKVLADELNAK